MNTRGRTGQQSGEVNVNHNSSKKHKKEASSDDEHPDSNRGRSKLERWTSHKERDFGAATKPPSSLKSRDPNTPNNSLPVEPSKKMEDMPQPLADEPPKATEDMQLDTVAKLKKRSERFKLPIRSEKDDVAVKKIESRSLPSGQTETRPDSEIKSERPARKRRWTGN